MSNTDIICVSAGGQQQRQPMEAIITAELAEQARVDTNRWIKRLRHVPYGASTMRERFRFRDDSLWWFTELYLQKMRQLDRAVLALLAFDRAWDLHTPTTLVVDTTDPTIAAAARAWGTARRRGVDVRGQTTTSRLFWAGAQVGISARLSRLRHTAGRAIARNRRAAPTGSIAAFVHTAFWKGNSDPDGGQESYIGPVLDALGRATPDAVALVGIGPRRNFTTRRWWDAIGTDTDAPTVTPIEALAPWARLNDSMALWRRRRSLADAVVTGSGIRDAALMYGCDLWPVLSHELRGVAQVQWPWSARAMDEAGAAIDALGCHTVLTYAEAGGWGRALVLEARRRGVRSVGLQHGFIYRHWLNYLHEPDEMASRETDRGFPAPDQTLLFDHYAEQHLRTAGAFPANRLTVTGSPRLDELVARTARFSDRDRQATRQSLRGILPRQKLAVLATKFTEVRDVLPALMDAIRATPDLYLAIKAHPAEVGELYASSVEGVDNASVVPADADLARLLAVADAVVTRNSTVAVDGLVLGLPALVIGLPSNLSPFVDAGVMLGTTNATAGHDLRRLLYDQETRAQLKTHADRFVEQFGLKARGTAADDTAAEILRMGTHR